MHTWRDHRSPRTIAINRIGPWPGETAAAGHAAAGGVRAGAFSYRHATGVWSAARNQAGQSVVTTHAAEADLAMVAALAAHLGACERCWRPGPYDTVTPAQWLTWAVAHKPGLARVLLPAMAEMGVRGQLRALPR